MICVRCKMILGLELYEVVFMGDYDILEEFIFSKKIDINFRDFEW